jgi:hypothetical protein
MGNKARSARLSLDRPSLATGLAKLAANRSLLTASRCRPDLLEQHRRIPRCDEPAHRDHIHHNGRLERCLERPLDGFVPELLLRHERARPAAE